VLEATLPYQVGVKADGTTRPIGYATDAVEGIRDYLEPFKKDFKLNIIEFSYVPSDYFSYFSSVDQATLINTNINLLSVYKEFSDKVLDSDYGKKYIFQTFNRYFDINLTASSDAKYNGQYLCSSQIVDGSTSYVYLCNTQVAASVDEQNFEYRAKPGFYTGICNNFPGSGFTNQVFGLITTDNLLLEIYLNNDGFSNNLSQVGDFCFYDNQGNRMSNYTTRYKSFVGNPSFRLSGGI